LQRLATGVADLDDVARARDSRVPAGNRSPVLATARSGRVNIVRRELCDVESELVAADADQIAAS
jgi:hypothetical protein